METKEYAYSLLEQANSNRLWAGLGHKRAKTLIKTAQKMEKEAMAILDSLGLGYAPTEEDKQMTDDELLAGLLG